MENGDRSLETEFFFMANEKLSHASFVELQILIPQLLTEAMDNRYFSSVVKIIEEYTDWRNDKFMAGQRDLALLLIKSKDKAVNTLHIDSENTDAKRHEVLLNASGDFSLNALLLSLAVIFILKISEYFYLNNGPYYPQNRGSYFEAGLAYGLAFTFICIFFSSLLSGILYLFKVRRWKKVFVITALVLYCIYTWHMFEYHDMHLYR